MASRTLWFVVYSLNNYLLRFGECRILAAQNEHLYILEYLLEHGASALAQSKSRDTALHWAAFRGNLSAVKLLLQCGAPVEAVGDLGNRPLHLASASGVPKVPFAHRLAQKNP